MQEYRHQEPWLEESALFDVLRQLPELDGKDWWQWPEDLRSRQEKWGGMCVCVWCGIRGFERLALRAV